MALRYRPDIDGLRAIAVLPVLAFHFDQSWASGGFVGVDVFFVISGFLITSIIRLELEEGRFSLTNFYIRRIRRILPALFAVIAFTVAIAIYLFLPSHLRDVGQSVVAAVFFASNFLFWQEAGYFEASVFVKPLLHTWSLAVEEQFYIIVPLLLMALARWRGNAVLWIGLLTGLSLLLSIVTTSMTPTAAYYLLPWRAWELGIGALLALGAVPAIHSPTIRAACAGLGLTMILTTVVILDKTTPFPGAAALWPTIGTALMLHAGANGQHALSHTLGSAPLVWIGKRSYSLYLWHWPVMVFFTYLTLSLPTTAQAVGLFIASLVFAHLSYVFVEQPFRRPNTPTRPTPIFLWTGFSMAALAGVAAFLVLSQGLPNRLPEAANKAAAFAGDRDQTVRRCSREKTKTKTWDDPCILGDQTAPVTAALIGDSHGFALAPTLDEAGKATDRSIALYAHDGCPVFADFQVYWINEDHDCTNFIDATYDKILNDPDVKLVIYTYRAQLYTKGWLKQGFSERSRSPLLIGPRVAPLERGADRAAFFFDRFDQTLRKMKATGKQVALVYPLPESPTAVPDSAARLLIRGGVLNDLTLARATYDARTTDIIAQYDRLVAQYDLIPIRLNDLLCDDVDCDLSWDGMPLYRDTTHLTATIARSWGPEFIPYLQKIGMTK